MPWPSIISDEFMPIAPHVMKPAMAGIPFREQSCCVANLQCTRTCLAILRVLRRSQQLSDALIAYCSNTLTHIYVHRHGLGLPQYAEAFKVHSVTPLDFPLLIHEGGRILQKELGVSRPVCCSGMDTAAIICLCWPRAAFACRRAPCTAGSADLPATPF